MYLSPGHCAYPLVHTEREFCRSEKGVPVARHVGDHETHVHQRGRMARSIPRHLANRCRSRAVRRAKLHGLRNGKNICDPSRRKEPHNSWKVDCWRCFWRHRSDVHLSLVSISRTPSVQSWLQSLHSFSDVLRRRFQINTMTGMGYQYKGIWDAIRVIVTQEGLKGLYKGIVPNLLKVAPSMASSWASFEFARDFMVAFGQDDD